MAVIRTSANMILKEILHHSPLSSSISFPSPARALLPGSCGTTIRVTPSRGFNFSRIRCAASDAGAEKKVSSRLSQVQQLLREAEERASSAGNEPTPQITLDHVAVSFARSGGPGGQNVNKVNTKVDMRFNVKTAYWLSDRIRERIMQLEKNRINKDGEIVISSTKTRTQKGNIDDALAKLQAIIDAAAYVPPPPSEEQKKKIAKMAAIGEQKRLKSKKVLSDKKAFRRSRDSWD
ncbi:Peptide chain release factor class I/class II [Corchorus capsularis]|uniref:Peptide chain release factor class I/class II n=1 Tax=Corchorus capsularis TaxID=210143 RepID=A0A1R3JR84_COCAP|nr:Peptide chain release factor class I/class II [Corchorus capsularis]